MASLPSNKGKVAIIGRYFLGLLPGGKLPHINIGISICALKMGRDFPCGLKFRGYPAKTTISLSSSAPGTFGWEGHLSPS